MLYTETDLEESMDKIETINFHEVKEVAGIKFWCYHAGHVLGAAMFMIEIAGVKVPCSPGHRLPTRSRRGAVRRHVVPQGIWGHRVSTALKPRSKSRPYFLCSSITVHAPRPAVSAGGGREE